MVLYLTSTFHFIIVVLTAGKTAQVTNIYMQYKQIFTNTNEVTNVNKYFC